MESHKNRFLEWVKRDNIPVRNTLPGSGLRKGLVVMFTNEFGLTFGPHEILGFTPEPTLSGRSVYLDKDSYWLPARPEDLTPVSEEE